MGDQIEYVVNITGCSREDAQRVLSETTDMEEVIDRLYPKPISKSQKFIDKIRPVKVLTKEQEELKKMRDMLKKMDEKREKGSTSSNQPDCVEQVGHCIPHEEMVQQSNCYQECQLPSLE